MKKTFHLIFGKTGKKALMGSSIAVMACQLGLMISIGKMIVIVGPGKGGQFFSPPIVSVIGVVMESLGWGRNRESTYSYCCGNRRIWAKTWAGAELLLLF